MRHGCGQQGEAEVGFKNHQVESKFADSKNPLHPQNVQMTADGEQMFETPSLGQGWIMLFSFWPPPHLSFGSGQSSRVILGTLVGRDHLGTRSCTHRCRIEILRCRVENPR